MRDSDIPFHAPYTLEVESGLACSVISLFIHISSLYRRASVGAYELVVVIGVPVPGIGTVRPQLFVR